MARLVVAHDIPDNVGWDPVRHLVRLFDYYFGAAEVDLSRWSWGASKKLAAAATMLTGRHRTQERPHLLFVAQHPGSLLKLGSIREFRKGFSNVYVWVVDSFWAERLPRFPIYRSIDHIFTFGMEYDVLSELTGVPSSWLPWGADALGIFRSALSVDRDIDLLRLGRQPAAWGKDSVSLARCAQAGIRFSGRPPFSSCSSPERFTALKKRSLCRARYTLAYSNLVDGSHYTHPRKEYITGRWTDALACGSSLIGIAPKSDRAFKELLWPGATFELPSTGGDENIEMVCQAVKMWSPAMVKQNVRMALSNLDWRHRLKVIGDKLSLESVELDVDLLKVSKAQATLGLANEVGASPVNSVLEV